MLVESRSWAMLWLSQSEASAAFGTEWCNHDWNFHPKALLFSCLVLQSNWIPSVSSKRPGLPTYAHAPYALSFVSTWSSPTCLPMLRSNIFPYPFPVHSNLPPWLHLLGALWSLPLLGGIRYIIVCDMISHIISYHFTYVSYIYLSFLWIYAYVYLSIR